MLRNLGLAMIFLCLFGAQPANAQTAQPKWALDGAGIFCTLSRVVEDATATASPAAAADPTTLVLRTYPGIEQFDFMVVRAAAPVSLAPGATMTVSFAPSGGPFVKPVTILRLGANAGKAMAVDYLPPTFVDAFAGATQVTVAVGKKTIGSYAIPNAAKAIAAFRECESAKLIEWGADPAAFAPGGKQVAPIGDAAKWITPDDLRLPRIGTGSFAAFAVARLTVGTDGHVAACDLIATNGNKGLDTLACKLLSDRARYEPARDKDGKALRSVVLYGTDWRVVEKITAEKF
jgi:hypothetical protein